MRIWNRGDSSSPAGRSWAATLAAGLLALSVLAAGCGDSKDDKASVSTTGGTPTQTGSDSNAPAVDLTTQTWSVPQDWGGLDPTKVAATNTGTILLIMEPLVLNDGNGGVTDNLATQTQPDPTTYVYDIRDGVKFSDGTPLTVGDVLYSLDLHAAKGSKSTLAGAYASVKSIKKTGPAQVTIKLKKPDVQFAPVAIGQSGIVSKVAREKAGKNAGAPDAPNVGTGPFTVASYVPGDHVNLVRNDGYWGTKPQAANLNMVYIKDESARLLAVQSGDLTGAFEIPPSQANVYGRASGMQLVSGVNPSITMLSINVTKKPWNDIHVRRAVAQAIDKDGLVKALLKGAGKAAVSVVQPDTALGVMSADEQTSLYTGLDKYPYDVTAAKAELAKSSVPNGFSGEIIFSEPEPDLGRIAQSIAQDLEKIGIKLKVKQLSDAAYTDAVFFKHTAPAAVVDFTTDSPDPISLPNYLTNSINTLAQGGYTNISEFTDPAADKALNDYLATPATDTATRGRLLGEALQVLTDNEPYVPIYNANYTAVVKKGITFKEFNGMWWLRRWPDLVTSG